LLLYTNRKSAALYRRLDDYQIAGHDLAAAILLRSPLRITTAVGEAVSYLFERFFCPLFLYKRPKQRQHNDCHNCNGISHCADQSGNYGATRNKHHGIGKLIQQRKGMERGAETMRLGNNSGAAALLVRKTVFSIRLSIWRSQQTSRSTRHFLSFFVSLKKSLLSNSYSREN
jgi:hypothetical protein